METKIILFDKKEDCCGCTACVNICPKGAITMQPDGLGFLYPQINEVKCVKCGLCKKVCDFNKDYDKSLNLKNPDVYAIQHKNKDELEKSQSGAAFVIFSDWILNHNGVVYGAGYSEYFKVIHKRAETKIERDEFRGSKYVQSDLNTVFLKIKNDLENGKIVLFTGTPCQTAGLKSFLFYAKVDTKKLFLIDLVCHGVPSPQMWNDYLEYLERKNNAKITKVNFRDKKFGWASHKESFQFNNTYTYTYTYLFYQHIMLRESCGNCFFANVHRPSDITIGDYWGIEKIKPELYKENEGVSLVLINTEKGKKIFEQIKKDINYFQTDLENCLQPNLQYPTILHDERKLFEEDYVKHGFVYVAKKYGNLGWKYEVLDKLRKIKNESKFLSWVWRKLKNNIK